MYMQRRKPFLSISCQRITVQSYIDAHKTYAMYLHRVCRNGIRDGNEVFSDLNRICECHGDVWGG